MQRTWFVLVALVGCGDNLRADSRLDIVGHNDLGGRGMSSAIAIADDTVYVGSRIDNNGILIIDASDPSSPTTVGEIPGLAGMSSRELRAVADLNMLVVLSMQCDPDLHGCGRVGAEPEAIKLYDITDRYAPVLTASYVITGTAFNRPRSPHEFYLRRDGDTVRLFVASPPSLPSLEIVDITDIRNPVKVVTWDPSEDGLRYSPGGEDILHSVAVSLDGTKLFLSHQLSGLLIADITALPDVSFVSPPESAFDFAPPHSVGPHSAVEVPGRAVLVVTEEVYPAPYGTGCPWGKLRTVDISNPAAPTLLAEFGLPENDPAICAQAFDRIAFTAHNVTATRDLAFVTWYAGGLQVLDLADPARPTQIAELRPEPLAAVTVEDPALGGAAVEMWSYPIIKDGLVYVVDSRNGLYILRYSGLHEEQVAREGVLEGNSNL